MFEGHERSNLACFCSMSAALNPATVSNTSNNSNLVDSHLIDTVSDPQSSYTASANTVEQNHDLLLPLHWKPHSPRRPRPVHSQFLQTGTHNELLTWTVKDSSMVLRSSDVCIIADATIPLPRIDVLFHSRNLWAGFMPFHACKSLVTS